MSTVSVINNKIKVVPSQSLVVTITKKVLQNNIIVDIPIATSSSGNTTYISPELEDGIYQVNLSVSTPDITICFVMSTINEQKALFEVDTIKTKSKQIQKNYNNYYDLIAFSIQYDRMTMAINQFNSTPVIPFTNVDLINYFDTITNYFKYDNIG